MILNLYHCQRSLWLNGGNIDLATEIAKYHPKGLHGVTFAEGCRGACDRAPCKNGGYCLELYRGFSCQCDHTPFVGQTCQEEMSVTFNGSSSIETSLSSLEQAHLTIQLSFVATTRSYEEASTLIQVFDVEEGNVLSLKLQDGLIMEVNNEILFELTSLQSSSQHQIRLETFDKGQQMVLKIDDLEPEFFVLNMTGSKHAWNATLIGDNFQGCMSSLSVNNHPLLKEFEPTQGACRAMKLTREITQFDSENSTEFTTTTTEFYTATR